MKQLKTLSILVLLTIISARFNSTLAQVQDREKRQYNVQVGDTIYKYDVFKDIRWTGYVVISKDENGLITARSFNGKETIRPYERSKATDRHPLINNTYLGKDELKKHLTITSEFTFELKSVKIKRGNKVMAMSKNVDNKNCSFTDGTLDFKWYWGDDKYFGLLLKNKSETQELNIFWKDALYVDMSGNTCPIDNVSLSNNQESSRVLENTQVNAKLIPTSCYTRSGSQITYTMALDEFKKTDSNTVRICIPVKQGNVTSRYDFYFVIDYISELEYLVNNGLLDI